MSSHLSVTARERAQSALSNSPVFDLRELLVEERGDTLLINGNVSCFYHKQLAQEAVRSAIGSSCLVNRVFVAMEKSERNI